MNLDRQWRRFGNLGLAFWSGGIPAFLILNSWYERAGRIDAEGISRSHDAWYRDVPESYADTHSWMFVVYLLAALIVFRATSAWVYRWAERRTDNYLALRWKETFIDKRRDREMRELLRDREWREIPLNRSPRR